MSLLDIISNAAGSDAIAQMGARVGLSPAQTQSAAAALLPALAGGMRRQSDAGGLGDLLSRVGGAGVADPSASTGNEILGQIFGSKDVSRTVAANAAASTGIGADQLKALLPLLASLSAGALASKGAGAQGGVTQLLGMLDKDGDGPMDEIMGMAGKLFGR
jgi:hypothetical protein